MIIRSARGLVNDRDFYVNDRYYDRDQLDVNKEVSDIVLQNSDVMHAMVNRRVRPPEQCVVVNHHD